MKYVALIPSYQPDELLLKVVNDCLQAFDVVVVDDGGGEGFRNIFDSLPKEVKLLVHEQNKGKGEALKTGFSYIKETYKDEDYAVVTIDGDGQHTFEDALKVVKEAERNPKSLILGSRNFKETDQKKSKVGNFFARLVLRLITKSNIYDTQTGLRAFTNANIDNVLEIQGSRYEYETNMLLYFSRKRIPIIETEIQTIYLDDNKRTHYNPLKDTLRIFLQFLKFSASSLIGFCVDYLFFTLFCIFFPSEWAYRLIMINVGARIISSIVNFLINLKVVFQQKKGFLKYALKYFALAIVILSLNTLLLKLFVEVVGINEFVSKLLVEVTLFICSFLVQKFFVFRSKTSK